MVKNISFDLWGTLIKGNSTGVKKHIYFYENHNPCLKSLEEVKQICDYVKASSDRLSESTGITVVSEHIVGNILTALGVHITHNTTLINKVINDCKEITLEDDNLPVLYDDNTLEALKTLKADGYDLYVSSNTGFLSGNTMHDVLSKMGIKQYFTGFIFSDEVGFSKPSKLFFSAVTGEIYHRNFMRPTIGFNNNTDFLHIGDNPFADGGHDHHYIINTNGRTILDLLDLLNHYKNSELNEISKF